VAEHDGRSARMDWSEEGLLSIAGAAAYAPA
jgi:hypothetical protein